MFSRSKGSGASEYGRRQLDKDLREATGDENYGVPNSLLQKIAQSTTDDENCDRVLSFVWDALKEKNDKKWRRIQKSLTLLEACMKFGSERCTETIKRELWQVNKWREHRVMEGGKDQGGGIRLKAETIADLCNDEARLKRERETAARLAGKITNVENQAEAKKKESKGARLAAGRFRRSKEDGGDEDDAPDLNVGSRADQIDSFMRFTGCTSRATAEQYLQRANWDANEAVGMYIPESAGVGAAAPSESEQRSLVQQVQTVTKASEKAAKALLQQSKWSPDLAIQRFFEQGPPPGDDDDDSSSSGSGSSSSSDSDDAPAGPKGSAKGGGGGGFGAPASGGFGAPTGGFGPPGGGRGGKGAAPFGGGGGGFGAPPAAAGRGGFGAAPPGGGGFGRGAAARSSSAGPSYPASASPNPFGGKAAPFGGGPPASGRGGPFGGKGGGGGFGAPAGGGGGFGAPPSGGGGFGAPPGGGGFGAPPGGGGFGAPPSGGGFGGAGRGGFGAPPAGGGFGGARPKANPFGGGGGGGFGGGGGWS